MRLRVQAIPFSRQLSPLVSRFTVPTLDSDSKLFMNQSNTYTIYRSLKPNYTIIDDAGFPAYYIQTKGFHPTSPHLTMYAGKDLSGSVIAFVRFTKSSCTAHLVRGHPSHAQNAIWEDLRRTSRWSGVRYRWEMAVMDGHGNVARKAFVWKRTRTLNVDTTMGQTKSMFRQSYKLGDEKTGEVLAVFSVDLGLSNFRRLAKVWFLSERYGRAFKQMVFLSALIVKEWED